MATFNLTVSFPDGQQTRVLNALKTHWTENGVIPTSPQVLEKLRLVVASNIKDIVQRVEYQAAVTAISVTAPDVT